MFNSSVNEDGRLEDDSLCDNLHLKRDLQSDVIIAKWTLMGWSDHPLQVYILQWWLSDCTVSHLLHYLPNK